MNKKTTFYLEIVVAVASVAMLFMAIGFLLSLRQATPAKDPPPPTIQMPCGQKLVHIVGSNNGFLTRPMQDTDTPETLTFWNYNFSKMRYKIVECR